MKKFIIKLSKLLIVLLIIIVLLSFLLEAVIDKNTDSKQFLSHDNWNSNINKNHDMLFIGNSRVWVQIDAELISNKTNFKVYNITQDGRGANILWHKYKQYLKTNTDPKEIFLQFDSKFISNIYSKSFYGKENYLTYVYHNPLKLNNLFKDEFGFNDIDTYIPLIRYYHNQEVLYAHITGIQNYNWVDSKTYKYNYAPMYYKWNENKMWNAIWEKPLIYNYNSKNINYIDSFRIYCQTNDIKLHLFHPPQSWTSYNKRLKNNTEVLLNYVSKYNLEFHDFNNINYNDSTLFYNHTHLNYKGSQMFTNQIIEHYFKKN